MADKYDLSESQIFMSLLRETAINTPFVLTADMVGVLVDSHMGPFPDVSRTASNMIGDGLERAQKLRKGWRIPVQIPWGGNLNTETAARLGSRCLGGTVVPGTEISVGSGVFDVITSMQTKAQGRIPKLSTIGYDLGGYKFVYPSMGVGKFDIAFDGDKDVTFQSNLINTGLYKINQLAATLVAAGFSSAMATQIAIGVALIVPPTPPNHHLMHPAATKVTYSDGLTQDFAADGDLIGGACGLDNQLIVKGMPGDPFLDPGNRKAGAYSRDIHRGGGGAGQGRIPSASMHINPGTANKAFILAQNGTDITSLTYLFRSEDPIPATTYFYEFEWKCMLAEIETVQSSPDGNDAAQILNFYPKADAITGGYWIQRIRTDNSAIL